MAEDACTLRSTYKNGSECGKPALYRVFGVACFVCERYAADGECVGHTVCVDHAAELRVKSVPQVHPSRPEQPPPFAVARIHSLRQAVPS